MRIDKEIELSSSFIEWLQNAKETYNIISMECIGKWNGEKGKIEFFPASTLYAALKGKSNLYMDRFNLKRVDEKESKYYMYRIVKGDIKYLDQRLIKENYNLSPQLLSSYTRSIKPLLVDLLKEWKGRG